MAERSIFRIWLRRDERGAPRFSLRFDVGEGRGLIRLDRPGVRLEPPARRNGSVSGLAPGGVRTATFLHVRGSVRDAWSLEALTDASLARIADTEWRLLEASAARTGGGRLEVPPDEVLPPTQAYRVADFDRGGAAAARPLAADPAPAPAPARPAPPRGPVTGLVRHLRREVTRLRVENDELRAQLASVRRVTGRTPER